MATAAAAPNQIQKFTPTFEPQHIALRQTDGKPVSSTFSGDQMMFTLTDGRKWFVDPYVADSIASYSIQAGEMFSAYKVEQRNGNQRTVTVQVRPLGNTASAPAKITPAVASTSSTTSAPIAPQIRRGETQHNTSTLATPAPVKMNGAGETSADILSRCYRDALDIALASVEYAKTKGLLLTPEFGDIRQMAATMYINSEGGRR